MSKHDFRIAAIIQQLAKDPSKEGLFLGKKLHFPEVLHFATTADCLLDSLPANIQAMFRGYTAFFTPRTSLSSERQLGELKSTLEDKLIEAALEKN